MGKYRLNHWKAMLHDDETSPTDNLPNPNTSDSYKAPSTPNQTLRQLQNGQIIHQKIINLRGLKLLEVQQDMETLLKGTHRQTCYLIIHGKGSRSENSQPKIKQYLHATLTNHPQVSAYCPALPSDGGQGAMYLLVLASTKHT